MALTKTSSATSLASTVSLTAATKRSSSQAGSKVSMPMIRAELTSRRKWSEMRKASGRPSLAIMTGSTVYTLRP